MTCLNSLLIASRNFSEDLYAPISAAVSKTNPMNAGFAASQANILTSPATPFVSEPKILKAMPSPPKAKMIPTIALITPGDSSMTLLKNSATASAASAILFMTPFLPPRATMAIPWSDEVKRLRPPFTPSICFTAISAAVPLLAILSLRLEISFAGRFMASTSARPDSPKMSSASAEVIPVPSSSLRTDWKLRTSPSESTIVPSSFLVAPINGRIASLDVACIAFCSLSCASTVDAPRFMNAPRTAVVSSMLNLKSETASKDDRNANLNSSCCFLLNPRAFDVTSIS